MSLIIRLADSFTDATLPLLYRDPILNAGSQFLFDFSNSYCWNPANAVADAAVIKNLLDGAPDAALHIGGPNVAGVDLTYVNGKGFQYRSDTTNVNANILLEPSAGNSYFQNAAHNYLLFAWVKMPNPKTTLAQVGSAVLTKNLKVNSPNNNGIGLQYAANSTLSSGQLKTKLGGSTNPTDTTYNGGPETGAVLVGVSRTGTTVTTWLNGAAVGTYTDASGVSFVNSSPLQLGRPLNSVGGAGADYSGLGSLPGAIFCRVYGEDLTNSGLTAQAVMTAEYTLNQNTF